MNGQGRDWEDSEFRPLTFERSVHREVVLIKVRRYRRLKMRFRPRGARRYW